MDYYDLNFSNNLKLLRQTYELSAAELSNRLGFKYGSTIIEFEKQKTTPSFSTFIELASFFGVTLDWLVGRSEIIYMEEAIEKSEARVTQRIYEMAEELDGHSLADGFAPYLKQFFPEYYDCEKRKVYYSLSVRANIVVLMEVGWLPAMYWSMYYGKYGLSKKGVMDKVKEFLHIPKEIEFKVPTHKKLVRGNNLRNLLKLRSRNGQLMKNEIPIYDVEENYQQLQQKMKEKGTGI